MKTVRSLLFVIVFSINILSQNYFFSFENNYSGWDTTGIDLQLGDSSIAWAIHPSSELSIDSSFSMQYYLENLNDAGKIWIQRAFNVLQHRYYSVSINYKFATKDFGMANLWTIITGVHLSPPTTAQEITYQGHTGNGFEFDTGYVWLDKNYEFDINSDTSNILWVVIGIWGNWEVARTYYIDSVSIQIQEDSISNLSDEAGSINEYYLFNNYPNPFNPTTTLSFAIPTLEFVILKVFDVLGNEIATLVDEYMPADKFEIEFNAKGLPSGVYFYRINAGSFVETKKMILLR